MSRHSALLTNALVALRTGSLALAAILLAFDAGAADDVFRQVRQFRSPRGEIGLRTKYLKAEYNYDPQNNTFTRLGGDKSYTVFETDIGTRWNLWDNVAFFGSGRVGAAESKSGNLSYNNSTLTEFTFGADYLIAQGDSHWIPEVSMTVPMKKLDFTAAEVAAGEGVAALTGKIKAQHVGKSWYFDSGLGLTFRDQRRSTLLPFNVGSHFNLGRSVTLGADLNGYLTVFNENESDLARHAWACTYNGCARRYGAVNPSLVELTGALQVHASPKLSLRLDAGTSIAGSNTAGGMVVALGINFMFGVGSRGSVVPASFEEQKLEEEFVPDTNEEVDHTQFEAPSSDPVRAAPVQPPLPRPRRNQDRLQNELDKTEMQIELRSTKKKK